MPMFNVQIVPCISDEASGPTYSVVRLSKSLIDHGCDTRLATLECGPAASPPPFSIQFPRSFGPKRLGVSSAMREWLKKAASTEDVRLIHSHGLWMMPNIYPGSIANRYKIPLIISPRGTMSEWAQNSGSILAKKLVWVFLQKRVLQTASLFHATAQSEYQDIRRLGFTQPVAVIPNGIDVPNMLAQRNRISETRTLLFLGRIHPTKNVVVLLRAWHQINSDYPDWQLQITGPNNNEYFHQMHQLVNQLRIDRVIFTGALKGEDKWAAYRDSDLFVLPTHSENYGMSVAESLAAGTPVIVTKGAPWKGVVDKGAGWWIDHGEEPLVASLREALSYSREKLDDMGSAGRAWMQAEFSWERIGEQMSDTYRWLDQGGSKPDWIYD